MKDILFEPMPEKPNSEIVQLLRKEIADYETTHVTGVPILLLIEVIESGKNFGQAVTELRKIHSGRYHEAPLSQNWL